METYICIYLGGLQNRRKMSLPSMLLMARMILRKDLSMNFVRNCFSISKASISLIFKLVCCCLYQHSNYISRCWSHPDITEVTIEFESFLTSCRLISMFRHWLTIFGLLSTTNCVPCMINCGGASRILYWKLSTTCWIIGYTSIYVPTFNKFKYKVAVAQLVALLHCNLSARVRSPNEAHQVLFFSKERKFALQFISCTTFELKSEFHTH